MIHQNPQQENPESWLQDNLMPAGTQSKCDNCALDERKKTIF
jgi:hypothetical protein